MTNPYPPPGPPPLAQPLAQPLAPTSVARPTFGAGVRSLFGGFGFVLGNPDVWPFALVPVAIACTIASLLGWFAIAFVPAQIQALLGSSLGGILATILGVIATALALLASLLIGFALAQPLSGPALERIVRRVEAKAGAPQWPPTSIVSDVLRSLESVVVSYAFGLPILAVLFVIDLIFPPAVFVTTPLKILVAAVILAWDLCDYPLSLRGVPVGARVSFMKRNIAAMLGFGFGLALLALLPCLLVLVLPAGVAGAARLVVEIERSEAQAAPKPPALQA